VAHVVVVGTGIAGLIAAHEASRNHTVTLVTKAELAESNTKYAQGGIAAAMFPDDSVASHIADTLRAGAGLNDLHAVEVLCTEGPKRIRDLIALGVAFDKENGELARGHEAAHSNRRVLHAGGDATGLAIELALVRAVKAVAVEVHEHTFMCDLVVDDGRVVGVDVLLPDGTEKRINADFVILASGGAGQLFQHTTNPTVATGDGIAAALRAGAAISDVEFYQFHPTSLAVPGNPLISEAVRGEGAILLDSSGKRFMLDLHPDGELAPRDVVARGIASQMAKQGGAPVLLDATALGSEFLAERFPGITKVCADHGFDWGAVPIPVTPAAHYWMGGVRTDDSGRTSLPGLLAVGEVSCTGVHGANRLASNSLLESLVFAWRAAAALDVPWVALDVSVEPDVVVEPSIGQVEQTVVDRPALRKLMWNDAGLYRSATGLTEAVRLISGWRADGTDVAAREDANLLDLARLVVKAALQREESRGAHFRSDFPETSEQFAHHVSWVRKVAVRVD
jgi:L-aspartate oxidase